MRWVTVDEDVEWDDEVDVVCTDAGVGGLASAIATARAGGSVMLASQAAGGDGAGWFTPECEDAETADYLHALTADIDLGALPLPAPHLPIRLVRQPRAVTGRRVPTFDGARLREWAMTCIPTASGYLYTRVTDWPTSALESADGTPLAVAEIGSMTPEIGDVGGSVRRWLADRVRDAAVSVEPVLALQRLVVADGVVAGAEFSTTEGPLTVRARHGVLVCQAVEPTVGPTLAPGTELRVAMVGSIASRFGRVELLTADPAVAETAAVPAELSGLGQRPGC